MACLEWCMLPLFNWDVQPLPCPFVTFTGGYDEKYEFAYQTLVKLLSWEMFFSHLALFFFPVVCLSIIFRIMIISLFLSEYARIVYSMRPDDTKIGDDPRVAVLKFTRYYAAYVTTRSLFESKDGGRVLNLRHNIWKDKLHTESKMTQKSLSTNKNWRMGKLGASVRDGLCTSQIQAKTAKKSTFSLTAYMPPSHVATSPSILPSLPLAFINN